MGVGDLWNEPENYNYFYMAEEPICFKRSDGILDIHNCRQTELGLHKITSIFSGRNCGTIGHVQYLRFLLQENNSKHKT